jgi:predicted ester cyclase
MIREDNANTVRRLVDEVWNRGDLAVLDDLFDATADHERLRSLVATLRSAFPDLEMRIERLIVSDSDVAVHWCIHGTQQGCLRGLSASDAVSGLGQDADHLHFPAEVKPTGRAIAFDGVTFYQFQRGCIVSAWVLVDRLAILRQLGALPLPAASAG